MKRLFNITVYKLLLINTLISTVVLSLVLIFSLQRISSEHPRQYLLSILFNNLIEGKSKEELENIRIDGNELILIPLDRSKEYDHKYRSLLHDLDNYKNGFNNAPYVAVMIIEGKYYAGAKNSEFYVVLPPFGEPLSDHAVKLIILIILSIVAVLVFNIIALKIITRPFQIINNTIKNIEEGELSQKIPLNQTFGEYRTVSSAFNKMLIKLTRMYESRKQMLLAIAHELRTPLARLKVRKDLIQDKKVRKGVLNDIESIEKILDSILMTEHKNGSAFDKIEPDKFIGNLLENYKDKNIRFKYNGSIKYFYFPSELLAVLVRNFVDNAICYGGDEEIFVNAELNADIFKMKIIDKGQGIEDANVQYITEPFWREDPSRQRSSGGYGLGLYICRSIIEKYNGRLYIESVKGSGTTVTVELPSGINNENIND